jgi:FtsZ-binding cell division protein ZapB
MEPETKKSSTSRGLIILLIIIILGLGTALVILYSRIGDQKTVIVNQGEVQQVIEDQKNDLTKQLQNMMGEYDALKTSNDTMRTKFDVQKERIRHLLSMNGSNLEKIRLYKKELETLRQIMRSYIVQIDSLNTKNKGLIAENYNVKNQLQQVSTEKNDLIQQKEDLTKKVSTASIILAKNVVVTTLNKRGKETSRLSRVVKVRACFTLRENAVALAGNKDIFIRITKPDKTILPSVEQEEMDFQGSKLPFTAKRQVEYENKDIEMCMYWDNANLQLVKGTYTVEIFCEGTQIGNASFIIEK